jgi:multicomponent Na+:H+ antiporter subunit E
MSAAELVSRLLLPAVVLAALWWVVSGGAAASWVIGLPAVAAATWSFAAIRSRPGMSVSLVGLMRFVPFFLVESLRGGLDVAWRTLSPRLDIDPGFSRYRVRLASPWARVFFANCASLLPGTLTADFSGDELELHMLRQAPEVEEEIRRLERAVAGLFGEDLKLDG